MTACPRCIAEAEAWRRAGDLLLDARVPGEDTDPDAWPLAREALASELLAEARPPPHAQACSYRPTTDRVGVEG